MISYDFYIIMSSFWQESITMITSIHTLANVINIIAELFVILITSSTWHFAVCLETRKYNVIMLHSYCFCFENQTLQKAENRGNNIT